MQSQTFNQIEDDVTAASESIPRLMQSVRSKFQAVQLLGFIPLISRHGSNPDLNLFSGPFLHCTWSTYRVSGDGDAAVNKTPCPRGVFVTVGGDGRLQCL